MDNELLEEKIARMEEGRPFVRLRSKPRAPCCRSPRAAVTGSPASAGVQATSDRSGGSIAAQHRVARAGIYRWREAANLPTPPRRRPRPEGPMPDAALLAEIRAVLAASPFHDEG
jgi:hypothetical protein